MKKTYTKPELAFVSYSSNEALCSGCTYTDLDTIYIMFDGYDVASANAFAASEGCVDPLDYDGYCKFTSSTTAIKIFTS